MRQFLLHYGDYISEQLYIMQYHFQFIFHIKSYFISNQQDLKCSLWALCTELYFQGSEVDTTEEAIVNSKTSLATTYKIIPGGNLLM